MKGQLYVNERPREISIAVKLLYLSLTTLIGNKTLGEEYVDLIYVNKKGNRLVQRYRKLLFILSYTLGPYLASRLLKRWNKEATNIEEDTNKHFSWKDISNTLLNIHLIIFYFKGAYYDVSKRVFGMRYAIGHKVEDEEGKFRKSSSDRYKILGYFLLAQGVFKGFPLALQQFKHLLGVTSNSLTGKPSGEDEKAAHELGVNGEIKGIPFIPPSSRKCILCLSEMMDPSCAPCGHLFCWSCIMNWCKEREECPLCRQRCLRQQILPLR